MATPTAVRRQHPRRLFRDRREAGRVLAGLLGAYRGNPAIVVLGLARGGVPVAYEVAAALGAPLDAYIVRKLGAPGHDEFAVGALAAGGRIVLNDDVVRGLGVTPAQLREVAEREGRELERREAAYRGGRPPPDVTGKTVILVDDGLATGASMLAAVSALRDAGSCGSITETRLSGVFRVVGSVLSRIETGTRVRSEAWLGFSPRLSSTARKPAVIAVSATSLRVTSNARHTSWMSASEACVAW